MAHKWSVHPVDCPERKAGHAMCDTAEHAKAKVPYGVWVVPVSTHTPPPSDFSDIEDIVDGWASDTPEGGDDW